MKYWSLCFHGNLSTMLTTLGIVSGLSSGIIINANMLHIRIDSFEIDFEKSAHLTRTLLCRYNVQHSSVYSVVGNNFEHSFISFLFMSAVISRHLSLHSLVSR